MKMAVFAGASLQELIPLEQGSVAELKSLLDRFRPKKTILSSVVNHDPDIETLLSETTAFHKLNHLSRLPFSTPVGKPETIGADRLALAAAAVHFYPEQNNLVIGSGTCITYNFINQDHEFLGGGISPGLDMRLRSLHEDTAKLPLVKADWNAPLIGYDTHSNILSGVVLGMANELDGFIHAYQQRFGNFNALLTGGNITILASHLKKKIFADPELMFKGLYALSEANNP